MLMACLSGIFSYVLKFVIFFPQGELSTALILPLLLESHYFPDKTDSIRVPGILCASQPPLQLGWAHLKSLAQVVQNKAAKNCCPSFISFFSCQCHMTNSKPINSTKYSYRKEVISQTPIGLCMRRNEPFGFVVTVVQPHCNLASVLGYYGSTLH